MQFTFNKVENCKLVCTKTYNTEKPEDKQKLDFLKKSMLLNYQHHWWDGVGGRGSRGEVGAPVSVSVDGKLEVTENIAN